MDVQATAAAAPSPAASIDQIPLVEPGAPAANAGGVPAVASAATGAAGSSQAGLAPAIAKLFGSGSSPAPITLNVSYKVINELDEIVTVFSDPRTGEEIAQFPSQVLVGLAEFFDAERGATLDRSA